MKRFLYSLLALGASVSVAWAADLEIPAGETLTVTDFAAIVYDGTTATNANIITLNEGCTVKVAAGVANANKFFRCPLKLLGNATLDLSDYDAATPFRLYASVYTASPDTYKLTVVNASDKQFWVGGNQSYVSYSNTQIPSCMISKGALALPLDTDLHFIGCTWIYRFPSEIEKITYEVDSTLASNHEGYQPSIFAVGTDVFGTDEKDVVVSNFQLVAKANVINAKQRIRVCKSPRGSSWGGGNYFKAQGATQTGIKSISFGATTVANDIVLEGGTLYGRGGTPIFSGTISGWGTLRTMGYGQRIDLTGELLTTNLNVYLGQRGTWIHFQNTRIAHPLTIVDLSHFDNVGNTSSYGGCHGYYFDLKGCNTDDTVMPIKKLRATKIINELGAMVYVYGRQTVEVGTLNGAYAASADGGILFNDAQAAGGRTQINVGTLESSIQVYLSTNTAMTVTNMASTLAPIFNYYRPTGANRTTLQFVNGSSAASIVKGASPNVLPRRILGHAGALNVGGGVANPAWTVSVDPTDSDPVLDGCEGSGALTVPASGTIDVVNTTGESLPKGLYPILTCTSGGAALSAANWPVTLTGWRQGNLEVVRGDTGLWLKVRGGFVVLMR